MKVFTEVKETQITNKTETKKYMSYDGILFDDEKSCRDYESALTKVNIISLTTSNNCKVISEYDMYNHYAGCEDYYYLVARVTESTKIPLKMLFNAYHCDSESARLDFEKTLKESSTLVFGIGCLGLGYRKENYIVDEIEDFHCYGTVEEFKKEFLNGFSLLDLD